MSLYHQPKKTERADLEQRRPLILSISLLVTMLVIVSAFEFRSRPQTKVILLAENSLTFEELTEVPPTEQPPPPPAVIQQPRIVEVPNEEVIEEEIKVQFDIDVTDKTALQEITLVTPQPIIEEEAADEIFLVVEQTAAPKGGLSAFYQFVSANIRYPAQARRMNIEGKVFVEFVVERDGKLGQFNVVKGIGAGCDEEAVRILEASPNWEPGKQRGKPVRQRMVLPIYFKLLVN